eukprot:5574414-Prymnesium_polylepis.1
MSHAAAGTSDGRPHDVARARDGWPHREQVDEEKPCRGDRRRHVEGTCLAHACPTCRSIRNQFVAQIH